MINVQNEKGIFGKSVGAKYCSFPPKVCKWKVALLLVTESELLWEYEEGFDRLKEMVWTEDLQEFVSRSSKTRRRPWSKLFVAVPPPPPPALKKGRRWKITGIFNSGNNPQQQHSGHNNSEKKIRYRWLYGYCRYQIITTVEICGVFVPA